MFSCLACLVLVAGIGFFVVGASSAGVNIFEVLNTPAPVVVATAVPTSAPPPTSAALATPEPLNDTQPAAPTATAPAIAIVDFPIPDDIRQDIVPERALADLNTLYGADYPFYDYHEVAERLSGRDYGERTVIGPAYEIGDRVIFTTDDDSHEAELVYISDNVYYWADESLNFDSDEMAIIADRLENEYYPQLVAMFGQEWRPGVDNDPRFGIMHLDTEGGAELGYFSSVDVYPRTFYSESNEQEVVYMNMGNLELGEELYYGTLVHEIQHLIQWYVDPNEATWMNEGLSQLAEIYLGLDTADANDYLQKPDIQVNRWNYDDDVVDAHYSAAYLFNVYFWEQLGDTAVQELSRHPLNGMAAVRAILPGYDERSFEAFVADWAAANYLDQPSAGPAYTYQSLDIRRPDIDAIVRDTPFEHSERVGQFGSHYIDLNELRGSFTLSFAGDNLIDLTDGPPPSGEQMWFVPPLDETGAQLTQRFDLRGVDAATLRFAAWYELEEDYDYAYVSISTDDGATWSLLSPENGQAAEYGPGFNGRSRDRRGDVDGWLKESISLNAFVGQEVLIRFEVYTDSAVTERGFAIDDIAIPEIGYESNVENGPDGWEARGFVQVGWQIPQQWSLTLVEYDPDQPMVTTLLPPNASQVQVPLEIGKGGGVLVITPMAPFTASDGRYWLSLSP